MHLSKMCESGVTQGSVGVPELRGLPTCRGMRTPELVNIHVDDPVDPRCACQAHGMLHGGHLPRLHVSTIELAHPVLVF